VLRLYYKDYKALECGSRNYFQQNAKIRLPYIKDSFSVVLIDGELVTISSNGFPDSWPKRQSLFFHILTCWCNWLSPELAETCYHRQFPVSYPDQWEIDGKYAWKPLLGSIG